MMFLKEVPLADRDAFRRLFHRDLIDFWDLPYFGFDVVKFDKVLIKPPDDTSTKEQVLKDYGQEAVDLCERLLG